MTRRQWLMIALVLVPIAILVALELSAPNEPPPRLALAPPTAAPPPAPAPRAEVPLKPRDAPDAAPHQPPAPTWEPSLAAPMRALEPVLRTCINEAPHVAVRELRFRFRPTPDGGFDEASLETQLADPQVRACVEDAFAEVAFTLSGAERFEPVTVTLIFDPAPK